LLGIARHFASLGRGEFGEAGAGAEWNAHHLREAFPWGSAPGYLLRDRDPIFGHEFIEQLKATESRK
jgi:hypothetical protein